MKQSINFDQFCNAFKECGRENQFSADALRVLFDHFEEVNPDYELDVIAICCYYSELDYDQIIDNFSLDIIPDDETDETLKEKIGRFLDRHTTVIGEVPGGFVVADF